MVSEVSRNHSGLSFNDGYAPFQLQGFTRHTHRAEKCCYWLFLELKLRKSSDDHYMFGRHKGKWRPSQKICVAASLETLREDPTICAPQKSATTGCFETTQRNL